MHVICVSDASFGKDVHPFVGGFLEWRHGPVGWHARKVKNFTPQSSCEIETAGVVLTVKEGLFVKDNLEFLGVEMDGPMAGITDNKAAKDVIHNPGATKRTTHFARWLHFARELCLLNALKMYLVTRLPIASMWIFQKG